MDCSMRAGVRCRVCRRNKGLCRYILGSLTLSWGLKLCSFSVSTLPALPKVQQSSLFFLTLKVRLLNSQRISSVKLPVAGHFRSVKQIQFAKFLPLIRWCQVASWIIRFIQLVFTGWAHLFCKDFWAFRDTLAHTYPVTTSSAVPIFDVLQLQLSVSTRTPL